MERVQADGAAGRRKSPLPLSKEPNTGLYLRTLGIMT